MITVMWIALAGGVGALARYALTFVWPAHVTPRAPRAILFANTLGSLIAGITLALVIADTIGVDAAAVVWIGFCGGLTTFSTFAVDTVLLKRESLATAWRNILLTVTLGLISASLGFAVTQLAVGK